MAFEDFLNHTCDVYHIVQEDKSPGYELPTSPSFHYPDQPDIAALPCHFAVKTATISTAQNEPANYLESRIKLGLPLDADVRINDKIVNCTTGYEYTAEQPITVQQHHRFVYIKRIERQKEL